MKQIYIVIFILGIFSSCESKEIVNDQTRKNNSEKQITQPTFSSCFDIPDTNYRQYVVGCSNTFYKLIKNKRVLSISTDSIIENGSCAYLTNDSTNNDFVAELQVFDSDIAVMASVCADMIIINKINAKWTKTLTVNKGQIVFGKNLEKINDGTGKILTTILVNHLSFTDTLTGEVIKIENELFWQVEDIGTPG